MSLLELTAETATTFRPRRPASELRQSTANTDAPIAEPKKLVIDSKAASPLLRVVPEKETSFEEQIFNSLVSLKVAVSQYAMHLSAEERHRIFDELDKLINVEDWHRDDALVNVLAFRDFLKWMIYSKYFRWISLGVSEEGSLLVAWKTPRVLLTARFSGLAGQDGVRWTAEMKSSNGEAGYAVGKSPLRLFAEQAMFYLHGARNEGDEHS